MRQSQRLENKIQRSKWKKLRFSLKSPPDHSKPRYFQNNTVNLNIMKKLFTLYILAISTLSFAARAQQVDPPKTGALIHVEEHQYKLKPGEEISFTAQLVKSRSAKKLKFGELSIKDSEQMAFQIVPSTDQENRYIVKAKAAPGLAPGKLYFVLKMTGKNSHMVRSTTLSFIIDSDNIVESN